MYCTRAYILPILYWPVDPLCDPDEGATQLWTRRVSVQVEPVFVGVSPAQISINYGVQ